MDTPEQLVAVYREEKRIGRREREFWPETAHATTDEYIAFLRTIPTGAGLHGVVAQLAKEQERPASRESQQRYL